MMSMDDSMSYPAVEIPGWKSAVSWVSAILLAILFLASGVWKIADPIGWAARVIQLQVPPVLSMPVTLGVGASEVFAAVLLLVPRFRRWGAWLTGLLLAGFMVYIGYHYNTLRGEECSCFPWLKRSVGPQFFIGDLIMLAMAVAAGKWANPSHSRRGAALVLAAIAVFTAAFFGVTMAQQSGIEAPVSVTVDGSPYPLRSGRVFVYFFDPACSHCFEAAKQMSAYPWGEARVLAVPTATPQFAAQFLADTGLKASLTNDEAVLREKFKFNDPPFAVALEDGRQKAAITHFDSSEPAKTLRGLGWIE
jgi:uncharacterized membrane protein YphA (DoxX/SURF4 family)